MRCRKHTHDFILHRRAILEFIHQDILIFLLPRRKYIRSFQKEIPAIDLQIIKVQISFLRKIFLISLENPAEGLSVTSFDNNGIQIDESVLDTAYGRNDLQIDRIPVRKLHAKTAADFHNKLHLLPFSDDIDRLKPIRISEDFIKDCVESSERHLCHRLPGKRKKAAFHLICRGFGKRDHQNITRQDLLLPDQI